MQKYHGCRIKLKTEFEKKGWLVEENMNSNIELRAKTPSRTVINVYKNGTVQTQGKENEQDKIYLNEILNIDSMTKEYTDENNNKVFIVHGHDHVSREELENILYRWNLKPVVSMKEVAGGNSILENLFDHIQQCAFGIVLLTPDDSAYSKQEGEGYTQDRARQNVILEMGMILGLMGKSKVMILRKTNTEVPSDMHGIIYTPYKDNVTEAKDKLRQELKHAGLIIED